MNAFYQLAVFTVLCALAAGCDKQLAVSKSSSDAFALAKPEVKQVWAAAAECSLKNDYLGATTNLVLLRAQGAALSAEQSKALEELWGAMGSRVYAAAEKGDAGAVQALKSMGKPRSR